MDQIPWMLVFFVAIALIVVILAISLVRNFAGKDRGDYISKRVFSSGSLAAFERVSEALPGHIVLAEVGFEAILDPGDWLSRGRRQEARNKISQKRADIVVCDQGGVCIAVIEIDDRSKTRDSELEKILESAGLKALRWPASDLPFGDEIRQAVLGVKALPGEATQPVRQIPTLWQRAASNREVTG